MYSISCFSCGYRLQSLCCISRQFPVPSFICQKCINSQAYNYQSMPSQSFCQYCGVSNIDQANQIGMNSRPERNRLVAQHLSKQPHQYFCSQGREDRNMGNIYNHDDISNSQNQQLFYENNYLDQPATHISQLERKFTQPSQNDQKFEQQKREKRQFDLSSQAIRVLNEVLEDPIDDEYYLRRQRHKNMTPISRSGFFEQLLNQKGQKGKTRIIYEAKQEGSIVSGEFQPSQMPAFCPNKPYQQK